MGCSCRRSKSHSASSSSAIDRLDSRTAQQEIFDPRLAGTPPRFERVTNRIHIRDGADKEGCSPGEMLMRSPIMLMGKAATSPTITAKYEQFTPPGMRGG